MCDECIKSLGELRVVLNALYRNVARMEQRLRTLEGDVLRGGIEGLEGEWTVTPPPQWEVNNANTRQG